MGRIRTMFSYTAPAIMAVLGLLWFWHRRKKPDTHISDVDPEHVKVTGITGDSLSTTDSINLLNTDTVGVSLKVDGPSGMNESGDFSSLNALGIVEMSKLHGLCGDGIRALKDPEVSGANTSVCEVRKDGVGSLILEQNYEEAYDAVTGDVIFASHASVESSNLPVKSCGEEVPFNNELIDDTSAVITESVEITLVDKEPSLTELVPALEELSGASDFVDKIIDMNDEQLHSSDQESMLEPIVAGHLHVLSSESAVHDQELLNGSDSIGVDTGTCVEQEELVGCDTQNALTVERTEEYMSVVDRSNLHLVPGSVSCMTNDDGIELSETSEKSETDSDVGMLSPVTDSGIVLLSPVTDRGTEVPCSDTISIKSFSPTLASSAVSAQIEDNHSEASICSVQNQCTDLNPNVDIGDIDIADNNDSSNKLEDDHSTSKVCGNLSYETELNDEQCGECHTADNTPDSVIQVSDHNVVCDDNPVMCDDGLVKSLSELTCLSVDSLESMPDTESRSLCQNSAEPSMPCHSPPEESVSPRSRSISLQSHDSLEPEPSLIPASLSTSSDKHESDAFSDISDTSLTEDSVIMVSDADNSVIIVSDDLAVLTSVPKKENRRRSRKPRHPKGDITFSSPALVDLTQEDDDDVGLKMKPQSDALVDSVNKETVVKTSSYTGDSHHKHMVETETADNHGDINQNCIITPTSEKDTISSQTGLGKTEDTQVREESAEHTNHPISWHTAEKLLVETVTNAVSNQNSDNNSEISNDSGKGASLTEPIMPVLPATTVYEFAIPADLTGRLIGRLGRTVNSIMDKSNCHVVVLANPFRADMKTVALEGTEEQIDIGLHLIRQRFPRNTFPMLSLNRIVNPAVQSMQAMQSPAIMPEVIQISLPMGVSVEVVVSSVISAGHLFVQQCYHPSFLALEGMHRTINACYSHDDSVPPLPWPLQDGVICVAPTENGWFRAQVMAVDDQTENCEVKFVDSGRFATLPYSDLRQIRRDFMTVPFQAVEVYMSNVTPLQDEVNFSDAAFKTLEDLSQGVILQAQVVAQAEDGIPLVHLYYVDGSKAILVNRELVTLGVARWIEQV